MRNHPNHNPRREFAAAVAAAASSTATKEPAELPGRRSTNAAAQDCYDDGLVHNHGWAIKEA